MATWTPQDLRNAEFVQTQLTPLDRGNALLTMNQNLTSVQTKLAENETALSQLQNQTNTTYSFGAVRAAKRAADQALLAGDPNATALLAKFEELQAKRSELSAQEDTLLRNIQSGELAVQTSQVAISNLEAAGAVPPGTNLFTPPPGYTDAINPPAQVPDSQNPSATPATTDDNVENTSPISNQYVAVQTPQGNLLFPDQETYDAWSNNPQSVSFAQGPGGKYASISPQVVENSEPELVSAEDTATANTEEDYYTPLQEPPGVTADEFAGIDEQVAANENGLQEPPQLTPEEVNDYLYNESLPVDIPPDEINDAPSNTGLTSPKQSTVGAATNQDQNNFIAQEDWRVRLSLSPGATYLYKAKNPGILGPLADTNGVIFPYTPSISVAYNASYDATELVHSNYKVYQYKNSAVDNIQITCDFTAQDTYEANYLLAVIHFFKSVTKMFYGQDNDVKPGTPPPLCFLIGLGEFQFNDHPLAVTSFNYTLPTDVDYIRASTPSGLAGVNQQAAYRTVNTNDPSQNRLNNINQGGTPPGPNFGAISGSKTNATYVPTKMQIQIGAIPIVARNDVSNAFSLQDYASGKLLRGMQNVRGGFW